MPRRHLRVGPERSPCSTRAGPLRVLACPLLACGSSRGESGRGKRTANLWPAWGVSCAVFLGAPPYTVVLPTYAENKHRTPFTSGGH